MNNVITTRDDLMKEEQRLLALLGVQKDIIKGDIQGIKEELSPAISAASTIMKFATYDNKDHVALKVGTNFTIDWLAQKLFPRSGFLVKMLLPPLLKNYSSHYVDKAPSALKNIGSKIAGLFNRKKKVTDTRGW
jgi:hypothetical protein